MKRRPTHPVAKRAVQRSFEAGLLYFSMANSEYTSVGKGYELADGRILLVLGDRSCYLNADKDPRPDYWHVVEMGLDGRTRRLSHPLERVGDDPGFAHEYQAEQFATAYVTARAFNGKQACEHRARTFSGTAHRGATVCMDCHQVVERWPDENGKY